MFYLLPACPKKNTPSTPEMGKTENHSKKRKTFSNIRQFIYTDRGDKSKKDSKSL
tara:strand:- start:224 stop:388 length:165 start_codon:yes stop_codon:yes gene_type:complete